MALTYKGVRESLQPLLNDGIVSVNVRPDLNIVKLLASVRIVSSIAVPTLPARFRAILNTAEPSPASSGCNKAVANAESGAMANGWLGVTGNPVADG